MRLIIAQYLRSLKERNEFDSLLPTLLFLMGYVPISKPQTGIRQYGVDLAAVGNSPEDGVQELLLMVIKRGDIGRNEWDSGPQSVRQSLNEIFDVYLKTHVESLHEPLRKKIVLATTGELKQDTQINWNSYTKEYSNRAMFNFWGGDHVAGLVEQYMLNEYVFASEDRTDLRKALALAGEIEYGQRDLHRLFLRQLGLNDRGELLESKVLRPNLAKALRVINLSSQIYSQWSEDENNLKQALTAAERATLWSWHRIQLEKIEDRSQYYQEFVNLWQSYDRTAQKYFGKLQPHLYVRDGLSGYCRENAQFSLIVFEQIGLVASIGLSQFLAVGDEKTQEARFKNANVVADGLANMLKNNPVSGSPRLDNNVVDIVLGMLLLFFTGHISEAQAWLAELVKRVDYTLKIKRNFPICTDSTEDLVESTVFEDEEFNKKLMRMSWLLPTIAGWSVILDRYDLYGVLSKNTKKDYPELCLQLWHPTIKEFSNHLYYHSAQYYCGESEAPILLPDSVDEYRTQMEALLKSERHNIVATSTAAKAGIPAIDLIACRHFKTPIAPFFWYQLLKIKDLNPKQEDSGASQRT